MLRTRVGRSSGVAERVLHAGRHQHERPGGRRDVALVQQERELAVEDVEDVVLVGVHVRLGAVGVRRHRDHADVDPRRVLAQPEELDVPEAHALPRSV